jgi:hypothetical protein
VSLGATYHSTPIPTVLLAYFFVAWLASLVQVRYFLCAWHTDQLKRMVATADRSPARYIFELKLAEVPSGPLRS